MQPRNEVTDSKLACSFGRASALTATFGANQEPIFVRQTTFMQDNDSINMMDEEEEDAFIDKLQDEPQTKL